MAQVYWDSDLGQVLHTFWLPLCFLWVWILLAGFHCVSFLFFISFLFVWFGNLVLSCFPLLAYLLYWLLKKCAWTVNLLKMHTWKYLIQLFSINCYEVQILDRKFLKNMSFYLNEGDIPFLFNFQSHKRKLHENLDDWLVMWDIFIICLDFSWKIWGLSQ